MEPESNLAHADSEAKFFELKPMTPGQVHC